MTQVECLECLSAVDLSIAAETGLVVTGVTVALRPAEIVGLTGSSGSGKSTLARALLGRLPAGLTLCGGTCRRSGRVALIAQEPALSLNPFRRIRAQLRDVALAHSGADLGDESLCEKLRTLGMHDAPRVLAAWPHELSGGQQQRVAWAIALLQRPAVLIADEPTSALDPVLQRQIIDAVMEPLRAARVAVLWISHDLGLLAALADRIVVLDHGRVVEEGPTAAVFGSPRHAALRELLGQAA